VDREIALIIVVKRDMTFLSLLFFYTVFSIAYYTRKMRGYTRRNLKGKVT